MPDNQGIRATIDCHVTEASMRTRKVFGCDLLGIIEFYSRDLLDRVNLVPTTNVE